MNKFEKETIHIIPNHNLDAYAAVLIEDEDGIKELFLEPVLAWEVCHCIQRSSDDPDTIEQTLAQTKPIVASGILNEDDYAIYYKESGYWFIPETTNGVGEDDCIEALLAAYNQDEALSEQPSQDIAEQLTEATV
nr:hypothetical protein [Endozoicomonas sp.]